jgi:hypothetical protein
MRLVAIAQPFAEDFPFQMFHQAIPEMAAITTEIVGAMSRLRKSATVEC